MKFRLNLVEIYNEMGNEYGEPLSDYLSYSEFIKKLKKGEYRFIETQIGDYIEIEVEED